MVPDGSQALGALKGVVVHAGGVLRHQHHRALTQVADPLFGGRIVRLQQGLEQHVLVGQETIGSLHLGHALTGFGNAGHRPGPKISRHRHQPPGQRGAQAAAAKLLFRPVYRRARSPGRQQARQLQRCAQDLAPIALQRIHEHVLARDFLLPVSILSAPSFGQPQIDPVGRAVARAPVAAGVDKGLYQYGRLAIALAPIAGQAPRRQTQHVRGQVGHLYRGQDQEPAVQCDPGQARATRGLGPADPLIAHPQSPGRRTEAQSAKPALLAADQVAQLRSAQRSVTQRVVRLHHRAPHARVRTCPVDHHQFDLAHPAQCRLDLQPLLLRPLARALTRFKAHRPGSGQFDQATSLELDQQGSATRLLGSSGRILPIHPAAHESGQGTPRQVRRLANRLADALENLVGELTLRYMHAPRVAKKLSRVPRD